MSHMLPMDENKAVQLCTVDYLKFKASIVVAWLLAVCFSGSLIGLRENWMSTSDCAAMPDHMLLGRMKWFPLLHRELLLPSCKTLQLRPGLLFLAMFASGRNFRRFNGTWAIVHSLLYGTVPSFPQGREKRGTCLKLIQNKTVPFMWPWAHPLFQTVNSLRGWDEHGAGL